MASVVAELPDVGQWDFYIAGAEPFVEAVSTGLRAAGVAVEQIVTEVL
jgi:ferredoxin-NADP reductase